MEGKCLTANTTFFSGPETRGPAVVSGGPWAAAAAYPGNFGAGSAGCGAAEPRRPQRLRRSHSTRGSRLLLCVKPPTPLNGLPIITGTRVAGGGKNKRGFTLRSCGGLASK